MFPDFHFVLVAIQVVFGLVLLKANGAVASKFAKSVGLLVELQVMVM